MCGGFLGELSPLRTHSFPAGLPHSPARCCCFFFLSLPLTAPSLTPSQPFLSSDFECFLLGISRARLSFQDPALCSPSSYFPKRLCPAHMRHLLKHFFFCLETWPSSIHSFFCVWARVPTCMDARLRSSCGDAWSTGLVVGNREGRQAPHSGGAPHSRGKRLKIEEYTRVSIQLFL